MLAGGLIRGTVPCRLLEGIKPFKVLSASAWVTLCALLPCEKTLTAVLFEHVTYKLCQTILL